MQNEIKFDYRRVVWIEYCGLDIFLELGWVVRESLRRYLGVYSERGIIKDYWI